MNTTTKNKLIEKFSKILNLQVEGKAEVMINYSGHVDLWEVAIYKNGWTGESKPDYHIKCYFDTDEDEKVICSRYEKELDAIINDFYEGTAQLTLERESKLGHEDWFSVRRNGEILTGSYDYATALNRFNQLKGQPNAADKRIEVLETATINSHV